MSQKLKVVLIDDDPTLCHNSQKILNSSEEFEVVGIGYNGSEAIEIIESTNPDVVILDIIMPKVDGLDVLSHFQDREGIEFIVLSAVEHDIITRKAIEFGAMYYLMKPFDPQELLEKLKALMTGEVPDEKVDVSTSQYYKAIEILLRNLGVPMHVKGYNYLYHGIYEITQLPNDGFKITQEVYPKIAQLYSTSTASVEKAIRAAVMSTFSRGNKNYIQSYFSKEIFNDKITNKAFMLRVASEVKRMI